MRKSFNRAPSRVDSFVLKKQYGGSGENKTLQQQLQEIADAQQKASGGELRERLSTKLMQPIGLRRNNGGMFSILRRLWGGSTIKVQPDGATPMSHGVATDAKEYEHLAMQRRTVALDFADAEENMMYLKKYVYTTLTLTSLRDKCRVAALCCLLAFVVDLLRNPSFESSVFRLVLFGSFLTMSVLIERNGLRSHSEAVVRYTEGVNAEHHNEERVRWGDRAHRSLAILNFIVCAFIANETLGSHEKMLEGKVAWLPDTFVSKYAGPFAVFCGVEDVAAHPGNATETRSGWVEEELNSRILITLKLFTSTFALAQMVLMVFIMVRSMKIRYRYAVVSGVGTMGCYVVLLLMINKLHEKRGTTAADDAAKDNTNVALAVLLCLYLLLLIRSSWEDEWLLQFTFLTKGVKDMKHFCGRFQIQSYEQSCMYTSSRCVVMRAIDTGENDDREDDVVIKFMANERCFIRELNARDTHLDPDLVLPVTMSSASLALRDIWHDEVDLKLEMSGNEFPFGLIMPAASKTLAQVVFNERINMVSTKKIMRSLGRALDHLHEHGRIHGDFNPSNAVRMADGQTWCLVDLDASVPIGSPALKPSVYSPPEFTTKMAMHSMEGDSDSSRIVFRVEHDGTSQRDLFLFPDGDTDPLLGDPSFDCWSFGVVLYRMLARRDLLAADDEGNPRGEYEMRTLYEWGPEQLSKAVFRCHQTMRFNKGITAKDRFLACDLLAWLLQRDPAARPHSMKAAITHPFLIGKQYTQKNGMWKTVAPREGDMKWHMPDIHVAVALGDKLRLIELLEKYEAEKAAREQQQGGNAQEETEKERIVKTAVVDQLRDEAKAASTAKQAATDTEEKRADTSDDVMRQRAPASSLAPLAPRGATALANAPVTLRTGREPTLAPLGTTSAGVLPSGSDGGGGAPAATVDDSSVEGGAAVVDGKAGDVTSAGAGDSEIVVDEHETHQSGASPKLKRATRAIQAVLTMSRRCSSMFAEDESGPNYMLSNEQAHLINTQDPLLGMTPLHIAASEGHVECVYVLLSHPKINVDARDGSGNTPIHTILKTFADPATLKGSSYESNLLLVFQAISERADLMLMDTKGRHCFNYGVENGKLRRVISQIQNVKFVVTPLEKMKAFNSEQFYTMWNSESKATLEKQLWETCEKCLSRPITRAKKEYMKTRLFTLDFVWNDDDMFDRLKKLAVAKSLEIVGLCHDIRDRELIGTPEGAKLVAIESFGIISHPLPPRILAEVRELARTPDARNYVDEAMFVHLIRALGQQAQSTFKNRLLECLGDTASLATWRPSEPPRRGIKLASKVVFLASLKDATRMAAKVGEYRDESNERGDDDVCWPHIQRLGDAIRCTIECESAAAMLESWNQIREEFNVSTSAAGSLMRAGGRLKNNLNTTDTKPPDMLVNVLFDAGGYELVAEVQIHLRSIHQLKQENHLPYEISRATSIDALVGSHMSEVSALKRTVANREENVARLKQQVSELTRQLSEKHQMYLQSDATLARVVRGDNTEFKRIYELNREKERLMGLAHRNSDAKPSDQSPNNTARALNSQPSQSTGKKWGALKGHIARGALSPPPQEQGTVGVTKLSGANSGSKMQASGDGDKNGSAKGGSFKGGSFNLLGSSKRGVGGGGSSRASPSESPGGGSESESESDGPDSPQRMSRARRAIQSLFSRSSASRGNMSYSSGSFQTSRFTGRTERPSFLKGGGISDDLLVKSLSALPISGGKRNRKGTGRGR